MTDETNDHSPGRGEQALLHLAQCVRFYSRIPVPALPHECDAHAIPDFSRAVTMLPVAALFIALPAAITLLVAASLWSPMIAAALATLVMVVATGAFHEDGLADTADGIGGGLTLERKLAIMADSRVGTYGACAVVLALLLRVTLLATLLEGAGVGATVLVLLAVASVSRVAGLLPLWLLPNARPDGKSAAVGRPGREVMLTTIGLSVGIAVTLLIMADVSAISGLIALAAAYSAGWLMTRLSHRMLGGQTGDVAGATQQCAEIASLLVLSAGIQL